MEKAIFWGIRMWLNTLSLVSRKRAGKAAMRLFFTPRIGRLTAQERGFLRQDAEWGSVAADGLQAHYYHWKKEGGGPTVLLAHGWQSNSARWRRLIGKLLAQNFQVVCLDAPAHGESTGRQFSTIRYARFMEALLHKVPADYAVGHSAGGMAIIYYDTHFAHHRFQKVVLLGTPGTFRAILDVYTNMLRLSAKAKHAVDHGILKKFKQPVEYFSAIQMLQQVKAKGLIIHDEGDAFAPIADAERMHANWKGSQFMRTKGLGHSVQGEHVDEAIVYFLKE